MNTKFVIKHVASFIGVSLVLAGSAAQSAQAADSNWFQHELQQTDGDIQANDAAPVAPTLGTDNPASPVAAYKGQARQPDDRVSQATGNISESSSAATANRPANDATNFEQ
jgi:hypothetical protein